MNASASPAGASTALPGLGGRDRATSRLVRLTLNELLLLDGMVSEEAQKDVEFAKQALACVDAFPHSVYGEIVADSLAKTRFSWRQGEYQRCSICEKTHDYAPYKSGLNRGRPNYSKPRYVPGIAFNEGFVTIRGHGNFPICFACNSDAVNTIKSHIIANRLPIELDRDPETLFVHESRKLCPKCHEEYWEFDSTPLPTLFGDGYYLGKCPHCGAGRGWFEIPSTVSERLIETGTLIREKGCWQRRKTEVSNG